MTNTKKPNRVRPVLRWAGGKSRMLGLLLPKIPEHVCYCEPFIGGGALLLAKARSQVEVINDLNGDLVALYLNIQRHLPEVLRQIETMVSSRELFFLFKAQPGLTEIERATRFLLRNRTSFAGDTVSFAVTKTRGGGAAFSRVQARALIEAMHERLDKVVIEHLSYERCFENYDSKETFFFLDPPYLNAKIKVYDGWSEGQLREFRQRVAKLKGKWMVTLDDSGFNRALFAGCKLEAVSTQNGAVNNGRHSARFGELIITPG